MTAAKTTDRAMKLECLKLAVSGLQMPVRQGKTTDASKTILDAAKMFFAWTIEAAKEAGDE